MSFVNVTINQLNQASPIVVSILSFINIVPGGLGLIFNILIFIRASLRHETCTIYFFWSTFFSFILILVILPVRVVAVNFNIDMANYNLAVCKIEYYTLYATRSTSSWLIVLACIDRYFHSSTNVQIRRMSSLKTTKIATIAIIITLFIVHCHMIAYYEITNVRDRYGNITPSCSGQKGIYSTFLGFWSMLSYSLCPCLLMLIFGVLTINNVRQYRTAIPIAAVTNRRARRTDAQLLRMLTAQVVMIIIFTLPLSIYQLYTSFTSSITKSTLQIAQENLAFRIVTTMTYFAHSSTFYLYTLTGTVFRKEFLKIIQRCRHPNRNMVEVMGIETHQMSVFSKK